MNRLWSGDPVTFEGRRFRLDGVRLHASSRPAAPAPTWIGGHGRAAMRRAARFGDGIVGAYVTHDEYAMYLEALGRRGPRPSRRPVAERSAVVHGLARSRAHVRGRRALRRELVRPLRGVRARRHPGDDRGSGRRASSPS